MEPARTAAEDAGDEDEIRAAAADRLIIMGAPAAGCWHCGEEHYLYECPTATATD